MCLIRVGAKLCRDTGPPGPNLVTPALDCSSYRPISLIPCDVKIYAKVFASRMEKVIHSLIKEDQTGFIKGAMHLTICVDSFIFLTLRTPTQPLVRSFHLMQKKAFDRLEWNYTVCGSSAMLSASVKHFVSMIKTLYHSPAASVITGNIISPSFPLQAGNEAGVSTFPLIVLSIS